MRSHFLSLSRQMLHKLSFSLTNSLRLRSNVIRKTSKFPRALAQRVDCSKEKHWHCGENGSRTSFLSHCDSRNKEEQFVKSCLMYEEKVLQNSYLERGYMFHFLMSYNMYCVTNFSIVFVRLIQTLLNSKLFKFFLALLESPRRSNRKMMTLSEPNGFLNVINTR